MMQVAAFLADPLLHERNFVRAHPADWALVRTAALRLDRQIAATHDVVPVIIDNPALFRAHVQEATVDCIAQGREPPLLGAHVDPLRRRLDRSNFFALCAVRVERPMPLLATQTGAFYPLDGRAPTLRALFETQRLWCDQPERDAPYERVATMGDDIAFELSPFAVIHAGTAWVRRDCEGRGLGRAMVRLNTMLCRLIFGRHLVFGTVIEGRKLERIMGGRAAGHVIQTPRPIDGQARAPEWTRLLVHDDGAALADAMKVLTAPPPTAATAA